MNPLFVYRLDALRTFTRKPCRINSGYRTPARNKAVGGEPGSAHLFGKASDVSTVGWTKQERRDFIVNARRLGFNGIGISPDYIHVDIMARQAAWIYVNGKFKNIPMTDELKYV